MNKTCWGISGLAHDASISVARNNTILFASSSERYSRIKNDKFFNKEIIEDCLNYGYPDKIIWYESPYKKFLRKLFIDKMFYNPFIAPLKKFDINNNLVYSDHHLSHLYASLYTAPFNIENSLGVVVDTVGEFLTLSIYDIKDYSNINIIYKHLYPDSLGLFYSSITQLVGLKPQEDEYILMGMASYGKGKKYYNYFLKHFFYKNNLIVDLRRGCKHLFSKEEVEKNKFNIALGAQMVYEHVILCLIKQFLEKTKYKKIIMSGGCALNCTANTKILNLADNLWIFPNPGDSGSAVGAALSFAKQPVYYENLYLGHDCESNIDIDSVISHLVENKVAGVMNGKAEFGPRALGNRSIIADPRVKNIKDIVNKIKGREKFRPFAPAILKSHFSDYFHAPGTNNSYPYMQFTFQCKMPAAFPGIVHVDGTSRVQTVDETTPFMFSLLTKWHKKTGCPMLLNTSLNIKGKPLLNCKNDISEFNSSILKVFV